MIYEIDELLRAWRRAAIREWIKGVRDFHADQDATPGVIHGYFETNGWGSWNGGRYTENGKTSWCGHFAAAMGARIGTHLDPDLPVVYPVTLDPDVARFCYPSTQRLSSANKWAAAGVKPPQILRRLPGQLRGALRVDDLRPGMTCTIAAREYGDRRDEVGGHIVLVDQVRADEGLVDTIEGNAHGELGGGDWGEGVVRRRGEHARSFDDFRRAFLLRHDHFDDLRHEA